MEADDEFSIFDVEGAILTGQIVERQKDSTSAEWKYIVRGHGLADDYSKNCGNEAKNAERRNCP